MRLSDKIIPEGRLEMNDRLLLGIGTVAALGAGFLIVNKQGYKYPLNAETFMADNKPLVGEDTGRWFLGEMAMKFAQSPQTLIAWEQRGCCPYSPIKHPADAAKIEKVINDSIKFMQMGLTVYLGWYQHGDVKADAEHMVLDPQNNISTIVILPHQSLPMNCKDAIVRRIAPHAQNMWDFYQAWNDNPPTKPQQERYWAWLRTNFEKLLLGNAHNIRYHYLHLKSAWWMNSQMRQGPDCFTTENVVFDSASPPNRKYDWNDYDPSQPGLIFNNVAPMVAAMNYAMQMRQTYPQVKLLQASKIHNPSLHTVNVFQNIDFFIRVFRAKASGNDNAYIRDVNVKPGEYGDSPWTPPMVEDFRIRQAINELEESEKNLQTAIAKRDAALNDPLAFFEGYIQMQQNAFDFDVKTKKSIVESCKNRLKKP